MNSEEELRKKKLQIQRNHQQNPFLITKFSRTTDLQTISEKFSVFSREELKEKNFSVKVSGRILRLRNFGQLIFALLNDQKASLQLMVSQKPHFNELDIGDIIGVEGIVSKSQKGELSIQVNEFTLLSKCLKPFPELYQGFSSIEDRFRQRYLDLAINRSKRVILLERFQIIKAIREFLNQQGFIEVETPILVSTASGAQAKPFVTYHQKLERNFYLRIASEIPLKMLLIGGLEKIYEIGRVFRNEGVDARHNPEFTTIEIYQAYEDAEQMMNLSEKLIEQLTSNLARKEFEFNSHLISLQTPFLRLSMLEAIKKYVSLDLSQVSELAEFLELAKEYQLSLKEFAKTPGQIILAFFEQLVAKKLIQPTFILDYPLVTSPLAKSQAKNPGWAERFELYIGGIEFANGYSELNDPFEQKKRFGEQSQQKSLGNEEIANLDQEFLEALEYGMPPAGGLGLGIDRLVMLFTEQKSIKEVIAFPQLKSKDK